MYGNRAGGKDGGRRQWRKEEERREKKGRKRRGTCWSRVGGLGWSEGKEVVKG